MALKEYKIEAGQHLELTLVYVPGAQAPEAMRFDLLGPGASLDLACVYVCPGSEELNFDIDVRHQSSGCTSRQVFRGVAAGTSRVSFDGLVYVKPDAQQTKAYQESHTLLLSKTAVAETRPQLEIYADDVECSHGATVGYLNEDELFYMRSRGIPEGEARRLQIISFLSPVLARLDETEQQKVLSALPE